MRQQYLRLLVVCLLIGSTSLSAWAETTREECMRRIGKHTNLAVGAGFGGVTGGAIGAAGCAVFLPTALIDLGLSYAACVAAVAAAGTIAGTAIAESNNNVKESECDELPRHK